MTIQLSQCGLHPQSQLGFSPRQRSFFTCKNYLKVTQHEYTILEVSEGKLTVASSHCYPRRQSCLETVGSVITTTAKVLSYLTLVLPAIAALWIYLEQPKYQYDIQDIAKEIRAVPADYHNMDSEVLRENRETFRQSGRTFHSIVGGLCLGDVNTFIGCTGLQLRSTTVHSVVPTDNPHGFKQVVTMCPLTVCGDSTYYTTEMNEGRRVVIDRFSRENIKAEELAVQAGLQRMGIRWQNAGVGLEDVSVNSDRLSVEKALKIQERWAVLIHNTTRSNENYDVKGHPNTSREHEEHYETAIHKRVFNRKSPLPVYEWFEPTFEMLDRAIFKGEKTLVHCRAGISRSATIIAAYLVKRFDVDEKQAIAYLRSKRPFVDPGFAPELSKYAQDLRPLPQAAEA